MQTIFPRFSVQVWDNMKKHVGLEAILLILMICLCSPLLVVNAQSAGWSKAASPTTNTLLHVWMVSSTDGWAVGYLGTILRWDGTTWNSVTSPTSKTLVSVFGVSAGDVWAVGEEGTIIHWNGADWNNITCPTSGDLWSVFGVSAGDVWAVGEEGTIIHWNGADWNNVTSPTSGILASVFGVSAGDVWAVGGTIDGDSTIIHWNGADWNNITSPTAAVILSVFGTSSNDIWATSLTLAEANIIHWNGADWNNVTSPTAAPMWSTFGVSSSDIWGVGLGGTIIHWNGADWNNITSPTSEDLASVFGVSAGDVWAVGENGIILRYKAEAPEASFTSSTESLKEGETVTFNATGSTDADGTIENYSWDFGDGNTASGITATHSFESSGTFNVKLTVTDNDGLKDTTTIVITVEETVPAGFPYWIILVVVLIVVAAVVIWYFLKKRKPKEKVPEPARIKLTAEPTELMADGTSTSTLTIELLDYEGKPVAALADTEISIVSSLGKVTKHIVKIPKGKGTEQTGLVASKEAGTATVSADAKNLDRAVVAVVFLEKKRYCMHCGSKMAFVAKRCPECDKSPPAGVDTKTCKNCEAVIPAVAKFCAECGASQPKD